MDGQVPLRCHRNGWFQMDVTFSLTSQLHVCCHVSVIINLSLLAKNLSRFSQAKMALAPACILRWEFIFRCQSFRYTLRAYVVH